MALFFPWTLHHAQFSPFIRRRGFRTLDFLQSAGQGMAWSHHCYACHPSDWLVAEGRAVRCRARTREADAHPFAQEPPFSFLRQYA